MNKPDIDKQDNDLSLPLPEPVVLGTAQTKVVGGGAVVGLGAGCSNCGIMQPFPVAKVNL